MEETQDTNVNTDALDLMPNNDNLRTENGGPLSKNQQKKLKKREKWLKLKAEKRAGDKRKRKLKYAEAREKGESLGPTRKSLKRKGMKDSNCNVKVVIDCSFDDMMSSKDVVHLTQQIQHSYAANRRADNALQFYVTGINGKLKDRLEEIGDYKGWDIFMKEDSYETLFNKEDIVYLSSESPNILSSIDDKKVYIIGGFVDHNHYKGYCHELAEKKEFNHAQLPIGEYIDMKARKVLTINHVFEILLRYTECQNWQEAFYAVLPQRKGAIYKNTVNDNLPVNAEPNSVITDKCENSSDSSSKTAVEAEKSDSKDLSEVNFNLVNKVDVADDSSLQGTCTTETIDSQSVSQDDNKDLSQ